MATIRTTDELRGLYAPAKERSLRKEMAALDVHARRFIALSPFVVLATGDARLGLDASPRGGAPGFVKLDAQGRLLIPDSPGNNRLDSLQNILATGCIGLLFMIPGVDETLRVNGPAELSDDEAERQACADARRLPRLVIRVVPTAVYLHCAKALLRSRLWSPEGRIERERLPTLAAMLADQTGMAVPPESREDMERRYAPDL